MLHRRVLTGIGSVLLFFCWAWASNPAVRAGDATADVMARGQYLVGDAGVCGDCHRPGLIGGPNRIPGPPGVPWPKRVPSLRGLPMFKSDADAIAFLTTAKLPDGKMARRPMPRYRFNAQDANAIVVYLRSLPPK